MKLSLSLPLTLALTPLLTTVLTLAAPSDAAPDAPPIAPPATAPDAAAPEAPALRAAAASGLAVAPARLDLGHVARDTTLRATAWLVNASPEPITVEKAKAGCGCTTVHFAPVTIAPGAAAPVAFDVKTPAKRQAKNVTLRFHPAWGEPVAMTVAMTTRDEPGRAPAAPARSGSASGGVVLVPVAPDLGAVAPGAAVDTSAWLVNAGDAAVRVRDVKAGCGCTTVVGFAPVRLAPGAAHRVRLRVAPPAPAGADAAGPVKRVTLEALLDDDAPPARAVLTMSVGKQVAGGTGR